MGTATDVSSPAEKPRHERKGLSLRNRIALLYTMATALLIALVFLAIHFMIGRIVYAHLDEELRHETIEVMRRAHISGDAFRGFDQPGGHDGDEEPGLPGFHHPGRKGALRTEFVQLARPDGTPFSRSQNLGLNRLELRQGTDGHAIFNTTVGGLAVRQAQMPLRDRNGRITGWLSIARPMGDAEAVLADLRQLLLLSYPAILLTLFLLTRSIAGRSIRPVEEVITAAEAITREHLDRRIPLPGNRDELYRLSVTLNGVLDRLQEAFQREKQFTSDASHELRTPLAAVIGTLEVLVRKPRDTAHYESRIRRALEELGRMNRLIDQLLLLARHEHASVPVTIREIALEKAASQAIDRIRQAAAARRIAIDVTHLEACRVQADEELLGMMLDNLLGNAIKYSPDGSTIELRAGSDDAGSICTIADHGEGIPEERLNAIFERFYRIDSSRNKLTGGFGLGLAIVRKLADLQHIGIGIESRLGQGTSFILRWNR